MLILCPSCATSYDVEPASLQPDGRQVRCVRCRTVWRAELAQGEKLIAAAAALAPARRFVEAPIAPVAERAPLPKLPTEIESIDDSADIRPTVAPALQAPVEEPESTWSVDSHTEPAEAVEVDGPPIVPVDLDEGRPPIDLGDDQDSGQSGAGLTDIETLAARRFRRPAKRRRASWPLSRLQTLMLALLVVDCVLIGWRKDIVRVLPQTASLYALIGLPVNLRGLAFERVSTSMEQHEGVPILVVRGDIVNVSGAVVDVPRVRLAVRNAAKQEIYSWTLAPGRQTLPPGLALAFVSRLASPPSASRGVLVRFLDRRDLVADLR